MYGQNTRVKTVSRDLNKTQIHESTLRTNLQKIPVHSIDKQKKVLHARGNKTF